MFFVKGGVLALSILILTLIKQSVQEEECSSKQDGCYCIRRNSTHAERPNETQCCCTGLGVLNLPANLNPQVQTLIMRNVSLQMVKTGDFDNYTNLRTIEISMAPELISFDADSLITLKQLRKLSITECRKLSSINGDLLGNKLFMRALTLKSNGLTSIPRLATSRSKFELDITLSHNQITRINRGDLKNISANLLDLSHNTLIGVDGLAFEASRITLLKLDNNPTLVNLDKDAFVKLAYLHTLDLSNTNLVELPDNGLQHLHVLKLEGTESLKKLPPVIAFTNLKEAKFAYPYHCCLFKYAKLEATDRRYSENLDEMRRMYCTSTRTPSYKSSPPLHRKRTRKHVIKKRFDTSYDESGTWGNFADAAEWGPTDGADSNSTDDASEDDVASVLFDTAWYDTELNVEQPMRTITIGPRFCESGDSDIANYYKNITCTPQPNALNPCEDVMGNLFLRVLIWFVWTLAIVGNVLVLIVLCLTRHPRMKVHYLLMMNLSFADLCTGVYLAMLAIEDVRTQGQYYNFAVEWQTGYGCQLAGFLSVFASELSIVAMFLISFDAWYNTRYVFYGKRMTLKATVLCLAVGWFYSLSMATLPLTGVSSYSATSTCLPLQVHTHADQAFIMTGLLVNLLAFLAISGGYISIYFTISRSSSPSTGPEDIQIAKKMAILIATDCICWTPTIIFGLTAAANVPLISISVAKIFLVVFYPINSCSNPFLYVFFTKMFRKDMSRLVRKQPWMQKLLLNSPKERQHHHDYYYMHPAGTTMTSVSKRTSANSTPRGSSTCIPKSSTGSVTGLPAAAAAAAAASAGNGQQQHHLTSSYHLEVPPEIYGEKKTSRSPRILRRKSLGKADTEADKDNAATPSIKRPKRDRSFKQQLSDISEHSHSGNSNEDAHNNDRSNDPLLGSSNRSQFKSDLKPVQEEHKRTFFKRGSNSESDSRPSFNVVTEQRRRASDGGPPSHRTLLCGNDRLSVEVLGESNASLSPSLYPIRRRQSEDQASMESGYLTASYAPTPELTSETHFVLPQLHSIAANRDTEINQGDRASWV